MTYLLDTNTCIGWMRQNQPQIVARINDLTLVIHNTAELNRIPGLVARGWQGR